MDSAYPGQVFQPPVPPGTTEYTGDGYEEEPPLLEGINYTAIPLMLHTHMYTYALCTFQLNPELYIYAYYKKLSELNLSMMHYIQNTPSLLMYRYALQALVSVGG